MWNRIKQKIVNRFPQLGWFIRYKQKIDKEVDEKDWVFGQDNGIIWRDLIPDGNWHKPLININAKKTFFEIQEGKFFDTIGCTAYGTLNGEELLEFIKWEIITNKSDRFTNKMSGNTIKGNLVSNVLESIRKKHGVVDEKDWSWNRDTDRWKDYYAKIPQEILDKGKIWLKQYDFNYERVGTDHNSIKEGLKKSPVGVGVYAWYKRGGLYRSVGSFNHWCIIIKQDWGKSYTILDSYEPFIKTLDWNYKFGFPRIFNIDKKVEQFDNKAIQKLVAEGREYIVRPHADGKFYIIENGKLIYEPDLTRIAEKIADKFKDSPQAVTNILKFLTQQNKVKWVTEGEFNELIK